MILANEKEMVLADVLKNSKVPVILYFTASWCGPCRAFGPILEGLSKDLGDTVQFYKFDIDENQETALEYNIRSVPTLVFIKDGQMLNTTVGLQSKAKVLENIAKL